jgi:stress response protein SCP2
MQIRYAIATGCPHGQFVVEAESATERAILAAFLGAYNAGWKFHLHGHTYSGNVDGPVAFNFGWSKAPPPSENSGETSGDSGE